jgi:putative N6-adenine-specific DNA methylase
MNKSVENKIEIVAKTFRGLEDVLASEITLLGGEKVEVLNRAVRYYGNKEMVYRSNLYLRTALKILVPVLITRIEVQEDLYEKVREFEWEKYMQLGNTFAIDTILNSQIFNNSQFVSLRVKDAIADRFRDKFRRRPSVNSENPDIAISVHLSGNELTLSVDTSGESLHRRGYRLEEVKAPINEVLAAGMIKLSGWDMNTDFYDPMCGSGTFGIEAAMMARKIPPGVFRTKFSFENSPDFEQQLWTDIFDDIQEEDWKGIVHASDISAKATRIAARNAKQASVLKNIQYKEIAFENYPQIQNKGIVILNPPYGERMVKTEINSFYQMIGNVMKKSFIDADVWIISSNSEAFKNIGLKFSEKYKLYNGQLECSYNKYEIYSGSRKIKEPK